MQKTKKLALEVRIAIIAGIALAAFAVLSIAHVIAFKPSNISDTAWQAGRQAYAIAQDYDAGRISTSEAAERLASVDMSYGTMDTGDVHVNANNAHIAYCVQALASHTEIQRLHEETGFGNDLHQSIRDDVATLAKAIGY